MPDGTAVGYAPRRFRFDEMLADAAVAAGAELWEETHFTLPVLENWRVAGFVAERNGTRRAVRARLVVGADGRRSRVARTVGAAAYDVSPAATRAFYSYWEGARVPAARLTIRDGWIAVAVPCGAGRTFLAVQWPHALLAEIRGDIEGRTRAAIAAAPWLAESFAGARPAEPFVGTGDLAMFFRTASGPGWALVGDAGNHKDPVSALGMTDALLDAELLAAAVLQGLGGEGDLDTALAEYGAARDRRSRPMHRMTAELARLTLPPPDALAGMAAIAADPSATSRFLGVMAGSVAPPETASEQSRKTVAA